MCYTLSLVCAEIKLLSPNSLEIILSHVLNYTLNTMGLLFFYYGIATALAASTKNLVWVKAQELFL